ncbi:cupin domain-containing protein [Altererythrobacter confluentis]|uniref:Cupin domain-containing protein n=1 Tax=Allopontixanthobacter confluentis TaxID=1849021 RepID=A0A6L7GJH4_9SPHN|nr:cupin domain-containing protein [Allopontixanthobacter confluentis]MXP15656.1 cupin domain-containing protein [Allopontixanthobacter confluentis]
MELQNFDSAAFLRDYWQQQPLLIRNPWARWANPLEPDELAGLACEEEVEARLVTHTADGWQLEHGPFPESRFAQLGQKDWTLLVQAADHHVPQVAELIEPFRFIPDWRIDDVLVSCAADGGGVGPHFDQYDVFLIQGLGTRRWQIGARCDENSELLEHGDLRLLARFEATQEWVLEPGDILYVPPGFAHNGIAIGDDCMTYSVGFRAPSRSDLIGSWSDDLLEDMDDDDRYADPGLASQPNPGEISAEAISRLHSLITEKMGDRDAFARWFGQYNTTPKYPEMDWQPDHAAAAQDIARMLANSAPLCRNPASRFSFIRQKTGAILLFVDGQEYDCDSESGEFAQQLCQQTELVADPALASSQQVVQLITALVNQGSLAFEESD